MKLPKKLPIVSIIIVLSILFVIGYSSNFLWKTVVYENHLKKCKTVPKNEFCGIRVISLSIPQSFIPRLLEIAETKGKRMEIPMKKQKGIAAATLQKEYSEIVHWYLTLGSKISAEIGETVYPTPLTENNSVSLVVYEKEGDSITWHFDTNLYEGRFFTLLLPVTFEKTCGKYEYRDADEKNQTIDLQAGQAILFEGEKVFHQGRPLCENEFRVILSCSFTTSQNIPPINAAMQKVKNWSLYGFSP
jgi:hypothetical protein